MCAASVDYVAVADGDWTSVASFCVEVSVCHVLCEYACSGEVASSFGSANVYMYNLTMSTWGSVDDSLSKFRSEDYTRLVEVWATGADHACDGAESVTVETSCGGIIVRNENHPPLDATGEIRWCYGPWAIAGTLATEPLSVRVWMCDEHPEKGSVVYDVPCDDLSAWMSSVLYVFHMAGDESPECTWTSCD